MDENSILQSKKQIKEPETINRTSEKSEFQREYETELHLHKTTETNLKSAKKSGDKPDSPEMQAVKKHLDAVTKALNEKITEDFKGFKKQVIDLSEEYTQLISSCETYLATRKLAKYALWGRGKRRRKRVSSVLEMAKKERLNIRNLDKDKELFDMRMEGRLVGTALVHAVFDHAEKMATVDFSKDWVELENHLQTIQNGKVENTYIRSTCCDQPETLTGHVNNSAAAGRLMRYMGLSEFGTDPKLTLMKNESTDEIHYGIRETVRGDAYSLSLIKETEGDDYSLVYYPEALRQIGNIKMICMLLGFDEFNAEEDLLLQCDKQKEDGKQVYYVKSVCIGNLGGAFSESINKKVMNDNKAMIDYSGVDRNVCEYIRSMEPGDIEFIVGDYLSKEQKAAFKERLEFIQKKLVQTDDMEDELMEDNENEIAEDESWKRKLDRERLCNKIMKDSKGSFAALFKGECDVYEEEQISMEELRETEKKYRTQIEEERKKNEDQMLENRYKVMDKWKDSRQHHMERLDEVIGDYLRM